MINLLPVEGENCQYKKWVCSTLPHGTHPRGTVLTGLPLKQEGEGLSVKLLMGAGNKFYICPPYNSIYATLFQNSNSL